MLTYEGCEVFCTFYSLALSFSGWLVNLGSRVFSAKLCSFWRVQVCEVYSAHMLLALDE